MKIYEKLQRQLWPQIVPSLDTYKVFIYKHLANLENIIGYVIIKLFNSKRV